MVSALAVLRSGEYATCTAVQQQPANFLAVIRLGRSRSHRPATDAIGQARQEPPAEAIEAFAKDVVDFVVKRRMRGAADA